MRDDAKINTREYARRVLTEAANTMPHPCTYYGVDIRMLSREELIGALHICQQHIGMHIAEKQELSRPGPHPFYNR